MNRQAIDAILSSITGVEKGPGNERVKTIVNRVVRDLFYTIEDLDVQPAEFWHALDYLAQAGRNNEFGLIAAGLGFEHFLDLRMDEAEAKAGIAGGTPRTIEGPLYVAGAPETIGEARLDDGQEEGEILFMQGTVSDINGKPLANALVEVWHANRLGNYSFFDSTQSPFNLRRSIRTDAAGRYRFRTIMPVGYSVPPGGSTDTLLRQLGRHGTRPAHIHFFVSAHGHRKLTTQINIDGDPYLWDDFAFATRDGLVPKITRVGDAKSMDEHGVETAFASIDFDFTLHPHSENVPTSEVVRSHASD
ncbi:mRNA 3'-end processing factor [Robbsia andropogonis]|uniref:catechol 1,2-dioxygenase n=1 Tax=Robbsia andropogonis TaxID=28092 RepID=A0A0F5JYR5_9BURK|nr:catechol 1,2-dioxygenase [Robbsia andropogonis]KKB62830.1 mRNA 3'-end processing factor [Robbsia andropogonis]MCP1118081.1 catechol 1,2-dioxygenase [Robbsia andropogonis]MCP1127638.1 catechol 1,2-dioxygenase [Robbsia andropogonis]